MGKVCVSCGAGPAVPTKPEDEKEDCVDCGGKETVEPTKDDEDSEAS